MADQESELTAEQVRLLDAWYPQREMVANLSWGLVGSHVLQIVADSQHVIVKAADAKDFHLPREIRAHREWLTPWTAIGRAPDLLHADESARIIATRYLPGHLVQGSDAEYRADTYRQAGVLLALLHAQFSAVDAEYTQVQRDETLRTLDKPHRLSADTARRTRELVEQWPDVPVLLVPTHGDWQPRNWLDDNGTVTAIDFGRAALRPALTDFVRLASRQFRSDAPSSRRSSRATESILASRPRGNANGSAKPSAPWSGRSESETKHSRWRGDAPSTNSWRPHNAKHLWLVYGASQNPARETGLVLGSRDVSLPSRALFHLA